MRAFCRRFSTQTVFHTSQKLAQRSRAAAHPEAASFDYLRDEVAARLVGRLRDITRSFPAALDLGSNSGNVLSQLLSQRRPEGGAAGGVTSLRALDPCAGMHARAAPALAAAAAAGLAAAPLRAPLEGAPLPLEDASVDLVLSSMALHWVNDVPGVLEEVRRVLRPDGAFLCAFLGGDTLQELRCE
jgi:NADH dehydrogenase [ubiquinone] 1 alpha subcomplex assembly factor 5